MPLGVDPEGVWVIILKATPTSLNHTHNDPFNGRAHIARQSVVTAQLSVYWYIARKGGSSELYELPP